jgi:hypothetical protein
MTIDGNFDRIAMDWLVDGPDKVSDRVLDTVADKIHLTRQRRASRVPWRFPTMTTSARAATAAVIGVLVIGGALVVLKPGTSSGIGGPGATPTSSPTPSASPTQSPTPSPSPSPAAIVVPAMTTTFASTRHGFDISYPAGWTATPATEPWFNDGPDQAAAYMDRLRGPDALLVVTSMKLGQKETPGKWEAAYAAKFGLDGVGVCDVLPPDWPTIQIGGREAFIDGDDCPSEATISNGHFFEALAFVDGRVYLFWLDGAVNTAYFHAMMDTVVFDTKAAID